MNEYILELPLLPSPLPPEQQSQPDTLKIFENVSEGAEAAVATAAAPVVVTTVNVAVSMNEADRFSDDRGHAGISHLYLF